MNCKNCEYAIKYRSLQDNEWYTRCTYEEGECVKIADLEEERSIEGIYQELLENAIEDSDGRPINAYVRMNLMQRARKIYSERVKKEEE